MNASELHKARTEIEQSIQELLVDFTKRTGLFITDVDVRVIDTTTYDDILHGHDSHTYAGVRVTAKL